MWCVCNFQLFVYTVLPCIALYCIVLYCIVLYCTACVANKLHHFTTHQTSQSEITPDVQWHSMRLDSKIELCASPFFFIAIYKASMSFISYIRLYRRIKVCLCVSRENLGRVSRCLIQFQNLITDDACINPMCFAAFNNEITDSCYYHSVTQ